MKEYEFRDTLSRIKNTLITYVYDLIADIVSKEILFGSYIEFRDKYSS